MSKQDWETPPEFIRAVEKRYGPIGFDLAAHGENTKAPVWFSKDQDSLKQDWGKIRTANGYAVRVAWLNPPFEDISPWAEKCVSVRDLARWTLLLVPASMGSLWWCRHVLNKSQADGVPRMKFVGAKDAYPKDLALCAYGYGVAGAGFWDWRKWAA
jgi:phage N-6-adenine-methyltransferase